jgi:acyl-CoA synthetase (NDP forming)
VKVDFDKLERAFNPRCVVIVGDSKKGNYHWIRNESTFQGKLYSVQVNPESIEGIRELGVENYTSLMDVPGPVDLVIVTVPRAVAPQVLEDCIRKDVACVHFFTAGFGETHTEEGIRLETQMRQRAEEANLHVVGPNCRGIFVPGIGLRQIGDQYSGVSGSVGIVSQSGGHAMYFAREAHLEGVDINKSVSFGNGITLHASDYLEHFGRDPEIRAIGVYVEGVRDGRRFFRVLRDVAARKPVVMWKGGWTEDGGRAISSHTGSLAIPGDVWNAAMRQCGVVQVSSIEGMIDTIKALLFLEPVRGNRLGVVGGAGGQSIATTDAFAAAGFRIPPLSQKSYDELDEFFSLVGGSYRNPLDTDAGRNRRELARVLEIVESDPNIDVLVLQSRVGTFMFSPELRDADLKAAVEVRQRTRKPFMTILPYATPEEMAEARETLARFQEGGVPVFPTIERGAQALRNALEHHHRHPASAGEGNA